MVPLLSVNYCFKSNNYHVNWQKTIYLKSDHPLVAIEEAASLDLVTQVTWAQRLADEPCQPRH